MHTTTIPKRYVKRIHVNQHAIKANAKNGTDDPVLTVKTTNGNDYGHSVAILDDDGREVARLVYSPEDPLSCGARVWLHTRNEVRIFTREES
jgi:hypothetical protein